MKKIISTLLIFCIISGTAISVNAETADTLVEEIGSKVYYVDTDVYCCESFDFEHEGDKYTIMRENIDGYVHVKIINSGGTIVTECRNDGNFLSLANEKGEIQNIPMDDFLANKETRGWSNEQSYVWNVGQATSVVTLAASIACAMSGIGLSQAIGIATGIVNLGLAYVWARTGISYKIEGEYQYCRRVTSFYKDSATTQIICGPYTIIQKKSMQYSKHGILLQQ